MYNKLSSYLNEKYSERVYKISVDGSFTCPNRDGTLSYDGCIYCNNKSFTPFYATENKPIKVQIENAIGHYTKRFGSKKFIVYFQAYTNTYGDVESLRQKYYEALNFNEVVGLSIGTRPDCLSDDVLVLLEEISSKTSLSIEFGVESSNEKTLEFLNRHHTFDDVEYAVEKAKSIDNIEIIVHIIFGLPYENDADMLKTCEDCVKLGIDGIKFHQLQVVENTKLAEIYQKQKEIFRLLSLNDYTKLLSQALEIIPMNVVIHRLFGTASRYLIIAPKWGLSKAQITQYIEKYFKENNIVQGSKVR